MSSPRLILSAGKMEFPLHCVGDDKIWKFRKEGIAEWTFKEGIISFVAPKTVDNKRTFVYNISSENGDMIATDILQENLEGVSPKFPEFECGWCIWKFKTKPDTEWTIIEASICRVTWSSEHDSFMYSLHNNTGEIIAADILEVNLEKVYPKFSDLEFDWYQWKFKSKADTEWTTIEARISQGTWSSEHYSFVYSLHNKTGEIIAADILEENLEIA